MTDRIATAAVGLAVGLIAELAAANRGNGESGTAPQLPRRATVQHLCNERGSTNRPASP